MNYRHGFHAGNHADVLKHVVLAACLRHLRLKDKPFAVIDAFAGAGVYDLGGEAAARTGEAAAGVGRVLAAVAAADAETPEVLRPWLEAIAAARARPGAGRGGAALYPGSPWIARAALRAGDRLVACEPHAETRAALAAALAGDRRATALDHDGWTAVRAFSPPRERRGLLLVDPPFEAPREFQRLARAVADMRRRWAGGIGLFWAPVKDRPALAQFHRAVAGLFEDALRVDLMIRDAPAAARLDGSSLLIVNPPWTLKPALDAAAAWLARTLAQGDGARMTVADAGAGERG